MTKVSCVIPTFNGLKLLQTHLPAVLNALPFGSQLIISDDASNDQTVAWLCSEFKLKKSRSPELNLLKGYFPDPHLLKLRYYAGTYSAEGKHLDLMLVANESNLRFGGAANLGVTLACHEMVMLLNNDASPHPAAFINLAQVLESNPKVFAVTALEFDDQAGSNPSGKNLLWFEMGLFKHAKAANFEYGSTAWASGGSSMFRLNDWQTLRGFDQRFYPAYWEDIDLSFRARRRGLQIIFEPKAIIYHKHESTHQSVWAAQEMQKISWRNADRFTWKNGHFWQRLSFLIWRPYWWWHRSRAAASQAIS